MLVYSTVIVLNTHSCSELKKAYKKSIMESDSKLL